MRLASYEFMSDYYLVHFAIKNYWKLSVLSAPTAIANMLHEDLFKQFSTMVVLDHYTSLFVFCGD